MSCQLRWGLSGAKVGFWEAVQEEVVWMRGSRVDGMDCDPIKGQLGGRDWLN